MIQSFAIYSLFGFFISVLGLISWEKQRKRFYSFGSNFFLQWEIILALILFGLLAGLRWNVGTDYMNYLKNYLAIQNYGYYIYELESGFYSLTLILAKSGFHFSFYFGFIAFLQISFVYLSFKNERYLYPFLGLVIIFAPHFLGWMDGMRQMLVATIFLWSVKFIYNRNFIKFSIIIFSCYFIHRSSVFLLFFYFIPRFDMFNDRFITSLLVIFSLILGLNYSWFEYLSKLDYFINVVGYSGYSQNLKELVSDVALKNFGPRRIVIILSFIILIFFSNKLKTFFCDSLFVIYYNFTIIGFLSYNLLANAHHIFIRPIMYLTIFSAVTISYLLVYLYYNRNSMFLSFLVTLIIVLSYLPLSIVAEYGKGKNDYVNYKFFWEVVN